MNNSDQPAFANPGSEYGPGSGGLTKREYFAAIAMQGMLAMYATEDVLPSDITIAQRSMEYADALLQELEKK